MSGPTGATPADVTSATEDDAIAQQMLAEAVGNDADPEGAEALGDPGKKALAEMKGKWKAERDKRRALEQEVAALKARLEGGNGQTDLDEVRRQAAAEALAKANARILRSEVKAAAAG